MYTHPHNSQANKWNKLKEYPRFIVLHIEEHGMLVPEWIYGAEYKSCHQSTEEGPPQSFKGEVIADLSKREYRHVQIFNRTCQ